MKKLKIELKKEDLTHIIHREAGYYEHGRKPLSDAEVEALASYIWDNSAVSSYDDILDYIFRAAYFEDITDIEEELHLPPGSGWDAILDSDKVEYVDQDVNLVILS